MTTEDIYAIIRNIIEQKRKNRVVPSIALYIRDICPRVSPTIDRRKLKKLLNELCRAKRLKHGKTINDKYFAL